MRLYRYLYWMLFWNVCSMILHGIWNGNGPSTPGSGSSCFRLFHDATDGEMIWNDNELIHCHFMSFHLLFHHGAVIDGLETPRASLLCKAQIINMFTIIWGTGIDHWMHGWQGCGKHQEDNGSRNGISARSQKAFVLRVATSGVHHYASPKTCQLTQEGDPLERWGAVSGCFWQGSTRPSKLKGLKVDKNRERETTQTLHTYSTSGEFWSLSYCCPR